MQLYFQVEPEVGKESIKLKALMDLFDEIVEEPLFNQLRLSLLLKAPHTFRYNLPLKNLSS